MDNEFLHLLEKLNQLDKKVDNIHYNVKNWNSKIDKLISFLLDDLWLFFIISLLTFFLVLALFFQIWLY